MVDELYTLVQFPEEDLNAERNMPASIVIAVLK